VFAALADNGAHGLDPEPAAGGRDEITRNQIRRGSVAAAAHPYVDREPRIAMKV
jgi:hypothetical protein